MVWPVWPAQEQGRHRAEEFVMVTVAQAAQCCHGDGGSVAVPVSGVRMPQEELAWGCPPVGGVLTW